MVETREYTENDLAEVARMLARRRVLGLLGALALVLTLLPAFGAAADTGAVSDGLRGALGDVSSATEAAATEVAADEVNAAAEDGQLRAGVAKLDSTWHVGSAAGQYAGKNVGMVDYHNDMGLDPHAHSTTAEASYGIQGRESVRALVVEGANGERFALVSNDLYIPQAQLDRRVAQLVADHDREVDLGLAEGPKTGIDYDNLAISVSHSHSSPYYSSTSWGPWLFEDVFDIRYFEHIARRMADAVVAAAADLRPVRAGASQSEFRMVKRHSYGPEIGDDGLPAGYPEWEVDPDLTVLAFDDLSSGTPTPLATWVIWGEHPEMLDGNDLLASEWVNTMYRNVDREAGGVTFLSQRDLGTSETGKGAESHDPQLRQEFSHKEYAQVERAGRVLADAVIATRRAIDVGVDAVDVPVWRDVQPVARPHTVVDWSTDWPVGVSSVDFAPPGARPTPMVSNCKTAKLAQGNVGLPILGLPDCYYLGETPATTVMEQAGIDPRVTVNQLREAGIPVPDNYAAPSWTGLEESVAVHLQAFRLGPIGMTICPCEQFADQSRNIETRLNTEPQDLWYGWDWTANYTHPSFEPGVRYDGRTGEDGAYLDGHGPLVLDDEDGEHWCEPLDGDGAPIPVDAVTADGATSGAEVFWRCRNPQHEPSSWLPPRDNPQWLEPVPHEAFMRMKAQIYNDAAGWDDAENSAEAESRQTDWRDVWGNYTQEELHAQMDGGGYELVLPISMSNDYWGYIVPYREWQSHDHYRKAMGGLGPYGSDFLATRLSRMAASLKGAPTVSQTDKDLAYEAFEDQRMDANARGIGALAAAYLPAYEGQLPADGGAPSITSQPEDITRFDAAQMTFVGGSNYTDAPHVQVQRCVDPTGGCAPDDPGAWETFANGEGETEVMVDFPQPEQLPAYRAGQFAWTWTATFEAFSSDITFTDASGTTRRQTPAGTYRFVVDGCFRQAAPGEADSVSEACSSWDPAGRVEPYRLVSEGFEVTPWDGIEVTDLELVNGGKDGVSFEVGPAPTFGTHTANTETDFDFADPQVRAIDYADSYDSPLAFIGSEDGPVIEAYAPGAADDERFCYHCTFRPWADIGAIDSVTVTVVRNGSGKVEQVGAAYDPDAGRWLAPVLLRPGDRTYVAAGDAVDAFGEVNGARSEVLVRPFGS